MSTPLATLLGVAMLAVALGPVIRWFGRGFQSLVLIVTGSPAAALYAYHGLLLPGTLLHELSHLAVAWLLRVPTGRLSLQPKMQGANMAQFGSVEVEAADPLRASLIGLAPLLAGVGAIFLIARHRLALSAPVGQTLTIQSVGAQLATARDAALWLYLVAAVGNAMLPSASDRRAWWKMALVLAVALGALYALGALARVPSGFVAAGLRGLEQTAVVLALLLLIDVALGSLFWLLTHIVGRLTGRRLVSR